MLKECLDQVRKKAPVVHNITNYVTVNDVANVILACGGSPIMSDEPEDVADITSICGGLNINLGTLHKTSIEGMLKAGHRSNELGHPVLLDPVGAGASRFRTEMALKLIKEIKFSVIRGNVSEIKTLAYGSGSTKGVDAAEGDKVTEENLDEMVAYAKNISEKLGSVIAMSGAIDIVADKNTAYVIRNGHSMMSDITGTGCMLSSVVGVFISANPDNILKATAVALSAYGLAGELAYKKTMEMDGYTSTLRMNLIDYMGKMNAEMFQGGAKIEVR